MGTPRAAPAETEALRLRLGRSRAAVERLVLGQARAVRLALACLLADGHLLLEDLPGMGKTTLAQALARVLGLAFRRVQFTADLLPADVTGGPILREGRLEFVPGPVFTHVLLADEVNRASPRTQSALLEAMEERQVSADGETRPLPRPFLVIATQNPFHLAGTHPLPESQLDRFLMRLRLGYPPPEAERELLRLGPRQGAVAALEPVLDAAAVRAAQAAAARVHAAPPLIAYVHALLQASRGEGGTGLSPRAGLALMAAARAWAWLEGRDAVLPEDVQAVFVPVAAHRLAAGTEGEDAAAALLDAVAIP
ncbi:AAA family ATPase [Inmirania thermothiophila]|uniref:MoxR-like ATPase n=1 Tax=Inmirania thermothiophila TaxID=1750597 RepID=A0A3N1Y6A4_9GAMM|nr:AAA family ATPase [Inmirania thermothiophila]ROR34349.1 MoxR-like ATPase [Inmirania thermothiophila]